MEVNGFEPWKRVGTQPGRGSERRARGWSHGQPVVVGHDCFLGALSHSHRLREFECPQITRFGDVPLGFGRLGHSGSKISGVGLRESESAF